MTTTTAPVGGIYIDVDGTPVPLQDITWQASGSCGCPFAWTVGASGGEIESATAEDAKEFLFGESKVKRDYHERSGATVRPIAGPIPRETWWPGGRGQG